MGGGDAKTPERRCRVPVRPVSGRLKRSAELRVGWGPINQIVVLEGGGPTRSSEGVWISGTVESELKTQGACSSVGTICG